MISAIVRDFNSFRCRIDGGKSYQHLTALTNRFQNIFETSVLNLWVGSNNRMATTDK